MTNSRIDFGLQSKPNIIIDMQNRNNFKLGLENYLESKLMLITCCENIIKKGKLKRDVCSLICLLKEIILITCCENIIKKGKLKRDVCSLICLLKEK